MRSSYKFAMWRQALSLPILRQILEERLPDFLEFSATLLRTLPNHEA